MPTRRNPIKLLPGQLDEDTSAVDTIHDNIYCDGAACEGVTECIRGIRYHCSRCANVDFCALCVQSDGDRASSLDGHDRSHPLLRCLRQAVFYDLAQPPEDVDRDEAVEWVEQKFKRVVDLRTDGHNPVDALGDMLLGEGGAGALEWEGEGWGPGHAGDADLVGAASASESSAHDCSTATASVAAQEEESVGGDGEEKRESQDQSREKGKEVAKDQDRDQDEQKETLDALRRIMEDGSSSRWSRANRTDQGSGATPTSLGNRTTVVGFDVRKQDKLQDALKPGIRVIGEEPRPESEDHVAVYNVEIDSRTTFEWRSTNAASPSKPQEQGVHHDLKETIKVICGQLGKHSYDDGEVFSNLLRSGRPATRVIELLPGEGEQKLQCRLTTVDVSAGTAYEAVCHAAPVESNFQLAKFDRSDSGVDLYSRSMANIAHPIYTPSGFVPLDFGVWNALRRLRRKDVSRYLWVDQISVDQSDKMEKQIQASYTRLVFNRAKRVLVWAGESDAYTSAAVAMFEKLETRCNEGTIPSPEELNNDQQLPPLGSFEWVALFEFFKRPVFQRIWSIQEVAFAQAVAVICGEYELSWSSVETTAALLASPAWIHHVTFGMRMAGPGKNGISRHDLVLVMKLLREQVQTRVRLSLSDILRNLHNFPVNDPRDKVFAILGLHPSFFGMRPDHTKEVAEVFTDATRWILDHEKSFDVCGSWVSATEKNTDLGLPSWVPNYASKSRNRALHLSLPEARYDASGSVPMSASWPLSGQTSVLQTPSYHAGAITAVADEPPAALKETRILWWIRSIASALGPRYLTGETTLEAFWRTCVVDASLLWQQQPAPESYLHALGLLVLGLQEQIAEHVDDSIASSFNNSLHLELAQAFESADLSERKSAARLFREVMSHHEIVTSRRNLFITNAGYLCLGSAKARVGDEVHVIPGAKVPFLLRKREKLHWEDDLGGLGYYTMVGEAYVHGLMSGEALTKEGFEWKDIILK